MTVSSVLKSSIYASAPILHIKNLRTRTILIAFNVSRLSHEQIEPSMESIIFVILSEAWPPVILSGAQRSAAESPVLLRRERSK